MRHPFNDGFPILIPEVADMKLFGSLLFVALALTGCLDQAYQAKITPLDEAVRENPEDAKAHYELGKIWLEGKFYRKAIVHLEQSLRLNRDNPEGFLLLGIAYSGIGRYDLTIKALQREEFSKNPESHFALGSAHMGRGDYETGKRLLKNALSMKPELARVYYASMGEEEGKNSPPLSVLEKAMAEILDEILENTKEEILEDIRGDIRESIRMRR